MREENWNAKPFLDLLFLTLLGFVFLFIVSFMLVEVDKKKANITTKAEYILTVTWDLNNPDDVDSWTRDPMGNLIWFRSKAKGFTHLDRDDVGNSGDTYTLPNGTTITYPYNQEITTIRGVIPGEWVFNIQMYNKHKHDGPAHVVVKMEKLNPSVKTVFIKNFTLVAKGDEYTVARFEMASNGEILWMDEAYISLFGQQLVDETREQQEQEAIQQMNEPIGDDD